jgi:hypothetical protein
MSIEIKVALIASISSLLIALFSLVTTYINHKLLKSEKREMQKHKNISKYIEALDSVNIAIQVFKDTIIYITSGTFSTKEDAIKKVIEDTRNIVSVYGNAFVNLDEDDKVNAHILKNKIIGFSKIIKHKLYDCSSIYEIDDDLKHELLGLKENLTETQDFLMKHRYIKIKALDL